jgi:nucleoside-diphosphate-sugar epimerase
MDLVTGGAGFIGSHLVEELVARGRRVRVLDNFITSHPDALASVVDRIELVEGDILDRPTLRGVMAGVERVFHQAALRSVPRSVDDPMESNRVNVEGTLNVLMAAREAGVRRVVYASSSSVYGAAASLPLREDAPTAPMSPYAVSKLAGEQYCRVFAGVYGLETVSLRYFNVFGARQDPGSPYAAVIPRFIRAAVDGQSLEIHGDGQQSRDFTHVRNVVLANCLAGERSVPSGEVFNIACGERYSLIDIVERLSRFLRPAGLVVRWHSVSPRPGDVRHTLADISKARLRLGFTPVVGFDEGLQDSLRSLAPELVAVA